MPAFQLPEQRILTTLHTVVLATEVLSQAGIPRARLLEGSGIAEADLQNAEKFVSHAQELRVFANALSCHQDPALGLYLGLRMHVSAYGILGYSMLASRTLRDALQHAMHYPDLLGTYFRLALQDHGDEVRLSADGYRYAPELTVFNTELCMTSLLTVVRDLLGESVRPRRLLLAYRPPLHACVCRTARLPGGVRRPDQRPVLRPGAARTPAAAGRSGELPQRAAAMPAPECRAQQPRRYPRRDPPPPRQSPAGEPQPGNRGAPPAPLQPHPAAAPAAAQHQLPAVLDEVRYDKARQLLKDTDLPIYLIAEQLGYSETASFRHAFQRWSGYSPSLYRG
jgi:hypothetical protein